MKWLNRSVGVFFCLVAFVCGLVFGAAVYEANAQRIDLPQRVAPQDAMPQPQGPIATWVFSIGRDTVGRTQIDVIGICRAAIDNGLLK